VFAASADAAPKKSGSAQLQAQCQAQAKKKYSAIHFLKRRDLREELHASEGLGAFAELRSVSICG
jgi:hypothetical protein